MSAAAGQRGLEASARAKAAIRAPLLREASLTDYAGIAAVMTRNGLAPRSYEDWVTLWTANPVYQEDRGGWPIGWVLEGENGNVVGAIGSIPSAYRFNGRSLRTSIACDWAVDDEYRAYSLMLLHRLTNQPNVDLVTCTTVSARSEPGFHIFKWSRVPVGAWDRRAFWITKYRGYVKNRLKGGPAAVALSYPAASLLWTWDKLRAIRLRAAPECDIEPLSEFDERFDRFWEELADQNKNVLLADRSLGALRWHFARHTHHREFRIVAVSKSSRLIGYAIFDREDNTVLKLKRLRLVDFQCLRGSEEVVRSALGWMMRRCREEGIHIIENSGCWAERPQFPKLPAAYHRSAPAWAFYYKANDKHLAQMISDPTIWAPSLFDGDASL